jgi:signal transduction histidine kinase
MRRAMLVLSAFGLMHGLHEWYEMFFVIASELQRFHPSLASEWLRVVVLAASFAVLVFFGTEMLHVRLRWKMRWALPAIVLGVSLAGAGAIAGWLWPDQDMILHAVDAWARYSLGAVGGVLAGVGLLLRARECRSALPGVARGWLITGAALLIYGAAGQTAPAPSVLFPSNVYNTMVFRDLFGFPVQLLRATAAVASSVGLLIALRGLERERQRAYEAAQTQARDELARRQALQTELLRRTVAAQEAERARIARELHDDTGQTLTALTYHAAALQGALATARPETLKMAGELHQLANQALSDLRQLVTDLRPAQLDDLGLVAALHWLADQARMRLGLEVEVEIAGRRRRLPGEVETVLFRIAQEALTNVTKHAHTDAACMRLIFSSDEVMLAVHDAGAGFDVGKMNHAAATETGAWGLIGMRERASSLGGQLEIQSLPGKGTSVRATIPVAVEEDAHG